MIHTRSIIKLLGSWVSFFLILSWSFLGFGQQILTQPANTEDHVTVILEDFTDRLQKAQAKTGWITLTIVNAGMSTHELVILRTELDPKELPRKETTDHNGMIIGHTVNEEDATVEAIDEIEEFPIGTRRTRKVFLAPGRYVFFCNILGHYDKGMYASFHVIH